MNKCETRILSGCSRGLSEAVSILRAGGLVAFPTETVYGLGADAANELAIQKLVQVKKRPLSKPFSVLVPDLAIARSMAIFGSPAKKLAHAFWPGALTLVLPIHKNRKLPEQVSSNGGSIGLRIPAHPVANQLLRAFGGPVATPSANFSGKDSPTRAEHVVAEMSGLIDAVIDAGPCPLAKESTIVRLAGSEAQILRRGAIPQADIETVLGSKVTMA